MTTTRPWRQEIELLQNYPKHKTFTFTTTDGNAATAVDISASMEECNKISFVVEDGAAYVAFDEDASTSKMYITQVEVYFDEFIYIVSKIIILRATTTNVRIRFIAWER